MLRKQSQTISQHVFFKVSLELWAEAANYSNYIRNRVLSSTETVSFFIYINKKIIIIIPLCTFKATPYEIWFGEKPDLSHLKVFGIQVFIHIPDEKRKKLDEKSIEGILVGYCDTSKAYRIWDVCMYVYMYVCKIYLYSALIMQACYK